MLQVEGLRDHSQKHSLQPFVKLSLMWAGSEGVELGGSTDEEVILSLLATTLQCVPESTAFVEIDTQLFFAPFMLLTVVTLSG